MNIREDYKKIANSKRPYAVVQEYEIVGIKVGTVISTHSRYELAEKAARSGNGFTKIVDARDYL
jgi:hypothetical protein